MEEKQPIRMKAILEIMGKPKDHVETMLKEYIEKIKQDENLVIMEEKFSEATEQGELWSAFAEIEMVIKGVSNLVGFCVEYMPSSIEIIKPEKFDFEERVFTNFTNDILAKLHQVDMIAKQMSIENSFLKKNMNNIIKNNILVLTRLGINTIDKMHKASGIPKDELKIFLELLVKEKRIKEEDGAYSIAQNE